MKFLVHYSVALFTCFAAWSNAGAHEENGMLPLHCPDEFVSSPLLLHCAEAIYAIDTTLDDPPVLNYDDLREDRTVAGSHANLDGLSMFTGPPPDADIVAPFFADAELSFEGTASAVTSATERHSSRVHVTPGPADVQGEPPHRYADKDGRAGTLSRVRLDPNGVSVARIQIDADLTLRDETPFSGPYGAPAHRIKVAVTNQDDTVLYSFDGAAELELDNDLVPFVLPPGCSGTAVVLCDDFVTEVTATFVDVNTWDLDINIDTTFPVGAGDEELYLEVHTLGAVFSSDRDSGVFDPGGWSSASPTTTEVTLTSQEGTFALVALVPDADLNMDGSVDLIDLAIVSENWGQSGDPGLVTGDGNKDGVVSLVDLALVSENWAPSPPSGASVPESSAFALLVMALGVVAAVRRSGRC